MDGSPAEILQRLGCLEAKVEAENAQLRSELLRFKYRLEGLQGLLARANVQEEL